MDRVSRWTAVIVLGLALQGATAAGIAGPPSPSAGDLLAEGRKSAEDSLLLTKAELAAIMAARAGRALPGTTLVQPLPPAGRPAPRSIHLGAILYQTPRDWRVWLNGLSYRPDGPKAPIEILEVTPDAVLLAWRATSGDPPVRIRLRPNQSYLIAEQMIVEGRPTVPAPAPVQPPIGSKP